MDIDEQWKRRFNAKWQLDKPSGCWLWTGACVPKGYGMIKIPKTRKQEYGHRLSWMIHRGPIPVGAQVLHRCDIPACVNPDHLFLGTQKENLQDMKEKGRHLYGERNHSPKLVVPSVIKIKALLATGILSQKEIASLFGVKQVTISKIHRGLLWAHVK